MVFDFRKSPAVIAPVLINDQAVEIVQQYKYLGMVIDNKLTFEPQVDAICKKANQRMYFYRKLRNFNVDNIINIYGNVLWKCFILVLLNQF